MRCPPAPDTWTARMVVHHLADSEMMSAMRLRRLIADDDPVIEGYDEPRFARRAVLRRPADRAVPWPPLAAARATTLQILERLERGPVGARPGVHTEIRPLRRGGLAAHLRAHAHDHADQIRRAISSPGRRRPAGRRRRHSRAMRPRRPRAVAALGRRLRPRRPAARLTLAAWPLLRFDDPHMTTEPPSPASPLTGPARTCDDRRPAAPRTGRRGRARRRPRHADAVAPAQAPPPAPRPPDARLRASTRRSRRRDGGRSSSTSPATAAIAGCLRRRRRLRPPGRADRHRRRGAGRPGGRAGRRGGGPRPQRRRAADAPRAAGGAPRRAPRRAARRRRDHERRDRRPGLARPGRPGRGRPGDRHRRGQGRHRRRARHHRDQRRHLRVRRGLAAAPDRRPPPSPATGEFYLTDLVRFASEDGAGVTRDRRRGRRARCSASTTGSSWPRPRATCGPRSTSATCSAGVSMPDPSTVYIEPTVELARDVTIEPNVDPPRPDPDRARGRRSAPAARSSTRSIGRDCRIWASVARVRRRSRTRSRSGRSPTSGRAARSAAGAKLGNYAEIKNTPARARASSSTT